MHDGEHVEGDDEEYYGEGEEEEYTGEYYTGEHDEHE